MKALLLSLLLTTPAWSQIERLNLFPTEKTIAQLELHHELDAIEPDLPGVSSGTKQVRSSTLRARAEHRFFEHSFVGVSVGYGEGEEHSARYGDSKQREFNSQGPTDPMLHTRTRLRDQSEDQGSIDLLLNALKSVGQSNIGTSKANRLSGQSRIEVTLAHGYQEGAWEFRSAFHLNHRFDGDEKDLFTGRSYDRKSNPDFGFSFHTQYELTANWYVIPGIGILYRGGERLSFQGNDTRKLQAGTASQFDLGLKRVLSPRQLLTLNLHYYRNEYFVRAEPTNFSGLERLYGVDLVWTTVF